MDGDISLGSIDGDIWVESGFGDVLEFFLICFVIVMIIDIVIDIGKISIIGKAMRTTITMTLFLTLFALNLNKILINRYLFIVIFAIILKISHFTNGDT